MGATRYVALYRTRLAHVLVTQGRDEDALSELERAREMYGETPLWLTARARVLARLGESDDAVRLAREAVASVAGIGDITLQAETLRDLAEVLRAHGDFEAAAAALAEAIALHEEKGNVLPAERCRELLATIPAGGPAAKGVGG
jgi:tetratricopeptide (TPR) repeat protein